MATVIRTTGELREFLVQAIIDVRAGTLDPEKAKNITRLASQVNDSFFSEIKCALVRKSLGQQNTEIGDLPINKA